MKWRWSFNGVLALTCAASVADASAQRCEARADARPPAIGLAAPTAGITRRVAFVVTEPESQRPLQAVAIGC